MATATPTPASVVVELPADAKLVIDDHLTQSMSEVRRFVSPPLPPGKDYHYTLKAEIVREGKPQIQTQQITVRAGEETRVTVQFPSATVASR
jgi:uncharacterized protein (TIGR03000 family)